MADNTTGRRSYRSDEDSRGGSGASKAGDEIGGRDPLAELARLIGQDDPFHEPKQARSGGPEPRKPPGAPAPAGPADWRRIAAAMRPFESLEESDEVARLHQASEESDLPECDPVGGAPSGRVDHDAGISDRFDAVRFDAPRRRDGGYPESRPPEDHGLEADRYQDERERGQYEGDPEHASDAADYDEAVPMGAQDEAADDYAYDDAPQQSRGHNALVTAVTLIGCAIIGTAGAYGYRTFYVGSGASKTPPVIAADTTPTKIAPTADSQPAKSIKDRLGEQGQERLVSREEQPIELPNPPMPAAPRIVLPAPVAPSQAPAASSVPGAGSGPAARPGQQITGSISASPLYPPATGIVGEAKRIRTIPIRPDGTDGDATPAGVKPPSVGQALSTRQGAGSKQPAPSRGTAPMSLTPQGDAPVYPPQPQERVAAAPTATPVLPSQLGSTPSPMGSGSYLVQLSSQRSEAEAQSSFRALQAKFPDQLGSRLPIIRRADLGDKGVFYRALVGPFATSEEASRFCSNYKAAGGNCIVPRN
jgi:hypothetical protein